MLKGEEVNEHIKASDVWKSVWSLMHNEIMDKKELVGLLSSKDYEMRKSAWKFVTERLDYKVIEKNELEDIKEFFVELLSSEDHKIRLDAWKFMPKLLDYEVIVKSDIIAKKKYFLDMLSSEDHKIRLDTWDMMRDFNLEFCSTRMMYYGVVEMSDLAEKRNILLIC